MKNHHKNQRLYGEWYRIRNKNYVKYDIKPASASSNCGNEEYIFRWKIDKMIRWPG